jgi:histone H3/H4
MPPAKLIPVTRPNTLERFMRTATKLKISDDVLDDFILTLNDLVTKITKKSDEFARKAGRKTIMSEDLRKALDEILGRGPLTVDELLQKIKPLSILELIDLARKIKKLAEDILNPHAPARQRLFRRRAGRSGSALDRAMRRAR